MNNSGQHSKDIKEAVQRLAGTFLKDNVRIIQAKVNCVHLNNYTCDCTPISGDITTDFLGVNLSANNNRGFIPIPALCSTVLIAESTKNNPPYLIGWDLLQGLICIIQNKDKPISQLLIENGTIQFNDGSYGGLIQIAALVEKINAIENLLNGFITLFNSHSHFYAPGTGAPIATTVPLTTEPNQINPTTQRSDLENTKVVHGV